MLKEGRAGRLPELVLYHLARPGASRSRVGFVVNRRVGGAVVRNRVKRLLREAVRPLAGHLPDAVDVVVVARPPAAAFGSAETAEAVREVAKRAGLVSGLDW